MLDEFKDFLLNNATFQEFQKQVVVLEDQLEDAADAHDVLVDDLADLLVEERRMKDQKM